MCPWAEGGNLRYFWEQKPRQVPTVRIIEQALRQLRGLADGPDKLHISWGNSTSPENEHDNDETPEFTGISE